MKEKEKANGMRKNKVWSARFNNGKGDKVFMSDEKAEEMLKDGFSIIKTYKKGEL